MKPRIKKKVSKKLAAILGNLIGKVWIDNEYYLHERFWKANGERLSGKHERINRSAKVCVNHMPVVGGGLDYYGEYNEPSTVEDYVRDVFAWTFFLQKEEDELGRRGYPVITERMTGKWLIEKAREYAASKEQS